MREEYHVLNGRLADHDSIKWVFMSSSTLSPFEARKLANMLQLYG